MSFLPDNYEIPSSGGSYMKLEDGDNAIRILKSPVIGYETWIETVDKKKAPVRIRMNETFKNPPPRDKIRHFWALLVWSYRDKASKVLILTQKSIQVAIKDYIENKKFGDPTTYDIHILRSGEGFDTEYRVQADPKEDLPQEILKALESLNVHLENVYDNKDPFDNKVVVSQPDAPAPAPAATKDDDISVEDVPW